MTTTTIYRVNVASISIVLSFIQVYCSCDSGPTLSCPGQWWNSWYIWVFIGSLITVVAIVGLRFLCQRYGCCGRCRNRQMMMPRRTQEQPNQLDNDQRHYVDGISAYCIPLPPDYNSCSSSPPPYHVIFLDTNKDRRPSPAELQLPQDLPSYEECVSNKSRTPRGPAEDSPVPVEGIEYSGRVGVDVTDGRTRDN